MIFVETPIFTAELHKLLPDEAYAGFQQFLIVQPDAGDLIQGTGGLRKVRWAVADKGKSGGVRVIYYTRLACGQLVLLTLYAKAKTDNLTGPKLKEIKHALEK